MAVLQLGQHRWGHGLFPGARGLSMMSVPGYCGPQGWDRSAESQAPGLTLYIVRFLLLLDVNS